MKGIHIRYNRNGSVKGFLGTTLLVEISDGRIHAPLGIGLGDIGQAEALLKCYGRAIEVYRKNSSSDLDS